jgi:hypothetical protein
MLAVNNDGYTNQDGNGSLPVSAGGNGEESNSFDHNNPKDLLNPPSAGISTEEPANETSQPLSKDGNIDIPQRINWQSITADSSQLTKSEAMETDFEKNDRDHLEAVKEHRAYLMKTLLDQQKIPKTYWENSPKEEKVLKFVNNFRRQYQTLFPNRKELLLFPENEFGTTVQFIVIGQ